MLEQLRQEIETLCPEAQTLLFEFIQVLKNNEILKQNSPNLSSSLEDPSPTLKTVQHTKPAAPLPPRKKGTAKGKLIIHQDDKDHLDFFEEYMP
ncbi:hypothetical protein [Spirulina subsalsa]|uniref:hypothetical protein n=1 Tax=Spirulina subsalsa TaxID=54311 RepID=UPI0002EF9FC7|nr:hypothetical protein [Spirulina subsalsa]